MLNQILPNPDFATQEEEILAFWQENEIYQKSETQNAKGEPYVIYDGPPTANAKPPLHTLVPMTFKDIVGRYQTMQGKYVRRQAGWDTHGLPVEVQVEKALGLAGKQDILNLVEGDEVASIAKFNEYCKKSVWEFKQDWDRFVPRVGYWTNTQNPYITYDSKYVEQVWGVFKKIWDQDLVYKGYKVVPYCPRCGTALSAAEVAQEYQDVKDTSVFVSFPLISNPKRSILAWTTTPWTLPGNVALAVGAEIDYVVVLQEEKEFILAKARLEILKGVYIILETIKGKELIGEKYEPLFAGVLKEDAEKAYKVLAADFVTTEDGTGIVHIAPMYGVDDFDLGLKQDLPQCHTVGLDGHFLPNVEEFATLNAKEALIPILKSLDAKGRLYAKQVITHSYPFCWRCKTALLYYAKDSWFIAMSKKRAELIKANAKVQWIPDHIKDGRFGDFIKEARDWAISRERFWGSPMPVWTSATGKYICVGSFEDLKTYAKDPSQITEDFDPHRPSVDQIVLTKDGEEYFHEPLVLDVWFDSGSMPYASGRFAEGEFPADYIAEAIDQTRGWFYTLQAVGVLLNNQSPYKRVVCMGHLVDEHGKKMSKSLGNIFDPWETMKVCGVDAFRWYIVTVNSPGEVKSFSIKELQTSFRKNILLLWNVVNYYTTYTEVNAFKAPVDLDYALKKAELSTLDKWILSKQAEVVEVATKYMEEYDFMKAGRAIETFVNELSTWYLRRSRKRADQAFFLVMHQVLLTITQLLAPFTPFVAEKIYQALRSENQPISVHLSSWPIYDKSRRDDELEKKMQLIRRAVEMGLSLRMQLGVKIRQPLSRFYITGLILSEEESQILADELNVLEICQTTPEAGMISAQNEELTIGLDGELTPELIQAGTAREFLRQIQNLRKNRGLNPGQLVKLKIDPEAKPLLESVLTNHKEILEDAFISKILWEPTDKEELKIDGVAVLLDLI